MPKAAPIQTNFTAGELSPRLEGRVDISKYFNGARSLKNMLIHTHGGITRRGGTKFISTAKIAGDKKIRLIPFQFSVEQAYILEVGENYIHFYRDEQKIGGGDFNSDFNDDFSGFATIFELTTTYLESELFEIQYVQSADVLYLVHPAHPPAKISRITIDSFTIADEVFINGPFGVSEGFPSCIAFYEERLVYAGTIIEPQAIWGSKTGVYNDFTTGPGDDDSYKYTIASDQVNAIRWMSPGKSLVIGTVGGEFLMSAGSIDEAITPSNIKIVRQTEYGCAYIYPVRVNGVVLFVQGSSKKIRQFVYQFESDSYVAPDLTLLSEHITGNGLVELAYQREPDSIVWSVREDGTLLGMTYERDQEVTGWHRHEVGGVSDVEGTKAQVESVAVIPKDGADQVWISVKRLINGTTIRCVEVIEAGRANVLPANVDDFFVDSGVRFSNGPTTIIGGGEHLEGETVQILADGAVLPEQVVVNGTITLETPVSNVNYGLGYVSEIETMRLEAGSANGTSQSKIKRINKVAIRFFETLGAKVGPNANKLDIIHFRSTSDPMDSAPPRFTGDKERPWDSGYETEGRILIRQEQPLPMTILAIMPRVRTND